MSVIKQFTISGPLRSRLKEELKVHLPSDLLYTFAAALYDKANRLHSHIEREAVRKITTRVLQTVKAARAVEEQYYGF